MTAWTYQENSLLSPSRVAALAQCWSTLWKVSHGETDGARQAVRYLREEVPLPHRYSVCAGLIEVLLAEFEEGELPTAVARLDSIVRPVPMESGHWRLTRDGTHWIDNLHLSQRLLEVGDTAGARRQFLAGGWMSPRALDPQYWWHWAVYRVLERKWEMDDLTHRLRGKVITANLLHRTSKSGRHEQPARTCQSLLAPQ